jgi:hypothetical protein
MERICNICKRNMDIEFFERKPEKPLGRGYRCKPCVNEKRRTEGRFGAEYQRQWRIRNLGVHRSYEAVRKGKWTEKEISRKITQLALKMGIMIRPDTCQSCGRKDVQVHHPDYMKPLDVQWLCRTCHEKADHPLSYVPEN